MGNTYVARWILVIEIQGYIGKKIYSNGDFKIYSFVPLAKDRDKVILNNYNTISISGEVTDLENDVLYTLKVKYKKNGKYDNYIIQNVSTDNLDTKDFNSVLPFLKNLLSEKQILTIKNTCPDIVYKIINNKEINPKNLNNIGEFTLQKIKDKVIQNFVLIDLVKEFEDLKISLNMMKKIYNHYTSAEMARKKIIENPYKCLCSINGIGFKKADAIILNKFPALENSIDRAKSCVMYLLEENELNSNTWIDCMLLYKKFISLVPQCETYFYEVIKSTEDIFIDMNCKRVSLRNTYNDELEISKMLRQLYNNSYIINIDPVKYSKVGDIELVEEQMNSLINLLKYNISILAGVGGSGKSFTVQAIVNMLEDNGIKYSLVATTGKASKVLSNYTNREASTIHKKLGYKKNSKPVYNKNNKLEIDVLIVDEFSMLDINLFKNILEAIDPTKTKILLIGDPAQIPSVGVGNVAHDMLESLSFIPKTILTKVFRYDEGGLSYVATKVRKGEYYLTSKQYVQKYGVDNDYIFINSNQENVKKDLEQLYTLFSRKNININDIMILTAYNKGEYGTNEINRIVQAIVNPPNESKKEIKLKKINTEITLREKDLVMQIKNNYGLRNVHEDEVSVFNGETGYIEKIEKDYVFINFGGEVIKYNKSELDEITLSYALTIHKSQGSSSKYVILITPKSHKFFLDRNLLYVGISRSKKMLYHIGTFDVIYSSLKKSQNLSRKTWLKEFLEGKC